MMFADGKLSIVPGPAPMPHHPATKSISYLSATWSSDAGDQWSDEGRDSALVGGFSHAYSGSSFYPMCAAYPSGQPEINSAESGFPGSAPSDRNMKLKSEHLGVVGVC